MDCILVLSIFIFSLQLALSENQPKVYEEIVEHNDRFVRQPNEGNYRYYEPPVFNYQKSLEQQDLLKHRYAQQQRLDVVKIHRNVRQLLRRKKEDVEIYLPENKEAENNPNKTIVLVLQAQKQNLPEEKLQNMELLKVHIPVKQIHPKKLYEKPLQKDAINRQDNNIPHTIYVQPNILKQNFGMDAQFLHPSLPYQDTHLNTLRDLIGKNPNIQLEGLRKLIESSNQAQVFPPVLQRAKPFKPNDHIPITEQSNDIPNRQSKPNIKVHHAEQILESHQVPSAVQIDQNHPALQAMNHDRPTLQSIQAELDESSRLEAEKVLKKAAAEARAHVEAQHQAIAAAQAEAQKAALAQVAAQNGHQYDAPQALPLKMYSNAQHEQNFNAQQTQTYPVTSHQSFSAVPVDLHQAHEYTAEQSYAPQHQAEDQAILSAPAHNFNRNPAYQVVLETKQQTENIKKIITRTEHQPEDEDNNQYASKYAFGYRIKDYKMGNDFGHEEQRNGKSAKGQYHVLLPDGRLQKVEYYADDDGYHAKVTYENVAHH